MTFPVFLLLAIVHEEHESFTCSPELGPQFLPGDSCWGPLGLMIWEDEMEVS